MATIYLNDSWITTGNMAADLDFDIIKSYIPNKVQLIKDDGHVYYSPLKSMSFGLDYGKDNEPIPANPIPASFIPYLVHANNYAASIGHPDFTQCNIDFFESKDSYTDPHVEDTTFMYKWDGNNSLTYQIFFTRGQGQNRFVTFRDIDDTNIVASVEVENVTIMIMGGEIQNRYTHEMKEMANVKEMIMLEFKTPLV